jgi:glycosyltransferase involved in cell wall biosynthesis
VVYFGGYVPLHSVKTIVSSARLLQNEGDIHFEMIGDGQTRPAAEALVQEWGLPNVTFTDWVQSEQLAQHVAGAQVCLGVFGHHMQAQITVPNKIYEALALRKALITQNSPAAMSQFVTREHLLFCPAEDPAALAEAILTLKRDPALCQQLAHEGHRLFQNRFTSRALGVQMAAHLQQMMDQ